MGDNMSEHLQQITGNFGVARGGQYARRPKRLNEPRKPLSVDPAFDREIAGIYASWQSSRKTKRSVGRYPSRAIANTAQNLQHPARTMERHLADAADAGIPLDKLEALGLAFVRRARALVARAQFKTA